MLYLVSGNLQIPKSKHTTPTAPSPKKVGPEPSAVCKIGKLKETQMLKSQFQIFAKTRPLLRTCTGNSSDAIKKNSAPGPTSKKNMKPTRPATVRLLFADPVIHEYVIPRRIELADIPSKAVSMRGRRPTRSTRATAANTERKFQPPTKTTV